MIQNIELERAMIASVCSYGEAMEAARDTLDTECFTDKASREVWKIITAISDNGDPVDVLSVKKMAMDASPELAADVNSMLMGKTYYSHYERVCRVLLDFKLRRQLYDISVRLAKAVENTGADYDQCVDELRDALNDMGAPDGARALDVTVAQATSDLSTRSTDKPTGTLTGFSMLDRDGGFHPQQLIVIGGCTGNGKTSLALSMALNAVESGAAVAYYSLEMSDIELTNRLIAIKSRVNAATVQYGCPTGEEWRRIDGITEALGGRRLYFDDKATLRIDNIRASIRSLKRKRDIDGAVVDYLQILPINTARTRETQEQALGSICRGLKNLAKELNIWIVVLSQINRGTESNPQPTLHRLRGSGQIEESADVVLLVYRPGIYGLSYTEAEFAGSETANTALIEIAKRRGGSTGKFLVLFDAEYTHFHEGEIGDRDTAAIERERGGIMDDVPF